MKIGKKTLKKSCNFNAISMFALQICKVVKSVSCLELDKIISHIILEHYCLICQYLSYTFWKYDEIIPRSCES